MKWNLSVVLTVSLTVLTTPTFSENGEQFFLEKLFTKYGDRGVLTFEGFEHLMENLGLGRLSFDKEHSLITHRLPDGGFQEVHDALHLHHHNHSRSRRSPEQDGSDECLTAQDILAAHGMTPDHEVAISRSRFRHICAAIVYELDQKVCTIPAPPQHKERSPPPSAASAWLWASVSILIISLVGLVAVSLVPILEKVVFTHVLSFLVAVAVGTLCGDALIHLLPHALESEEDEDHSVAVLRSSTAFLTVMFFFLLEGCIHGGHSHDHTGTSMEESSYSMVPIETPETKKTKKRDGTVGRLVIIGDGLHNLTDGLAVGAAFRGDITAGCATALAVLTHELPHELGDFAVLLKTGMPIRRALFYNMVSSILSFAGMAGGVYLGNLKGSAHWIYAATAGSFLYIALADLVPELHKYRAEGKSTAISVLVQLFGTFVGGGIMFLIAIYEEALHSLFSS